MSKPWTGSALSVRFQGRAAHGIRRMDWAQRGLPSIATMDAAEASMNCRDRDTATSRKPRRGNNPQAATRPQ